MRFVKGFLYLKYLILYLLSFLLFDYLDWLNRDNKLLKFICEAILVILLIFSAKDLKTLLSKIGINENKYKIIKNLLYIIIGSITIYVILLVPLKYDNVNQYLIYGFITLVAFKIFISIKEIINYILKGEINMNLQVNETKDQLFWDKDGELIAYVNFPQVEEGTHVITKVFVDESLRGQGVAGKLMEEMVNYAKENSIELKASCPYAISWFEKNK